MNEKFNVGDRPGNTLPKGKVLPPSAMHEMAQYNRGDWFEWVDNDVTLDDILRPAFWQHHVKKMKPGNRIDIVRRDFTLDVEVRVIRVEVGMGFVRLLRHWEDEAVAKARAKEERAADEADLPDVPPDYKVGSTPKAGNYFKIPTGEVFSGHPTKRAAIEAAVRHFNKANGIEGQAELARAG